MEKNITVENLVKLYKEDKTADKKNFYSQLKVGGYVPYMQKAQIAQKIFDATCMEDGRIVLNSPIRYLMYCRTVLDLYTNIKLSEKNPEVDDDDTIGLVMMAEFDALNSLGLIEAIFAKIPERELNEFNTVLDMVSNDAMTNKTGVYGFFSDIVNRLIAVLNGLAELTKDVNWEELLGQLEAKDE